MNSLAKEKVSLRKQWKTARTATVSLWSKSERQSKDEAIASAIMATITAANKKQPGSIKQVFLFSPLEKLGEPNVFAIAEPCLEQGLTLGLPVCSTREARKMTFVRWSTDASLVTGMYGIQEPEDCSLNNALTADSQTLIIVPALCIDMSGTRLGFGAGYYDTFLADAKRWATLTPLYEEFLLVDDLPCDEHDVGVDLIVTDQQVVKVGNACTPTARR